MERVRHGTFFAHQGWYPGSSKACQRQIDQFIQDSRAEPGSADLGEARRDVARRDEHQPAEFRRGDLLPGRAGVVPHAGWAFSGGIAARVFEALARLAGPVDTVVLFGGHLGPRSPGWVLSSGIWPTPLGEVEVDTELAEALSGAARLPAVGPGDYEPDNTIELQLPFIKALLPEVRLVAAGMPARPQAHEAGQAAAKEAARLGRNILVVGSTDLTHYGPNYGFEPAGRGRDGLAWVKETNDRRALDLMLALDPEALRTGALESHFCCCPGAAAAALGAAKTAGAKEGQLLEYLTSYDVRPGESFVGYAGLVF